jgi:plasmid stabilization system protein ParE
MAGTSKARGSGREGARALDYVKTQQEVEASAVERAAAAKAAKASQPPRGGSGDSPKRQGDKLEKARDAAAGRARSK